MQFPYFSAFPAELRDAIWEHCLPHPIIDIDSPTPEDRISDLVDNEDLPLCALFEKSLQHYLVNSGWPPLISRVCREARSVALRNGGWLQMGWEEEVWLDPARDVLHLNWNPYVDDFHFPYHDGLVGMFLGSQAKRVSITWDLATASILVDEGPGVWICSLLEQRRSYELSVGTVVFHVAETEKSSHYGKNSLSNPIISSGLFGMFGEERVKQVDARDHGQLERYAQFNREHGSPQDSRATEFFQSYYKNEDAQGYVDGLQINWLQHRWSEAKNLGRPIEAPEMVWPTDPQIPEVVLSWQAPNLDHPWVKTVLREMAAFRPVYTIQVCTQKCE